MSARALVAIVVVASLAGSSCTLLAEFEDKQRDAAGVILDAQATDGSIVILDSGAAAEDAGASADGPVVGVDTGVAADSAPPKPFSCIGQQDGTAVPGSPRRCCAEESTDVVTNEHCGGCNIGCNVGAGHSCVVRGGHAYCDGCAKDGGGGNAACWTGCCTVPLLSNGICAPELPCGIVVPICSDSTCSTKSTGTSCHTSFSGTYCSY